MIETEPVFIHSTLWGSRCCQSLTRSHGPAPRLRAGRVGQRVARLLGLVLLIPVGAVIFTVAPAAASNTSSAMPLSANISPTPQVGLWYTAWWTKDDRFHHWDHCHRLPVGGPYTAGDPAVIARHYAQFRDMGIDFLIMDDTNDAGNDGGLINDNIRAWFDFMDRQPPAARIPICIGGGGEMRAEGRPGQQRAADFYWTAWAQRPSYFHLEGKPLLLVDTDKNYGPGDFDDPRFSVRWVYNGDNHAAMLQRKTWGWGSYEPAPILKESMSIWPGHCFPQYVEQQGLDPVEQAREGGRLYARMWLRTLKAHPRFVTIADWNNFQEETSIEDSYSWDDELGYTTPDLYRRITRAYSRLRTGTLVSGECYQDEKDSRIFLFNGKSLVRKRARPLRSAVIVTPHGVLQHAMGKRAQG